MRSVSLLLAFLLAVPFFAQAATLERGIFRIEHHPDDAVVAEKSAAVLENAQREFAARLPAGDDPVNVIIAHTLEEFMRHAKSFAHVNVGGIARSEAGLIVVKAPRLRGPTDDFAGTLRHEFVHVLLYRNADTDRLPRWLNEGICMSLANEYRWAAPVQIARMFVANRMIPYPELDMAFLAPGSELEFGDAYAQALSMTRFLRERLGEERFWQVVLGTREMSFADAMRAFGDLSVADLWEAYHSSLWRIALVGTLASGSLLGPGALLVVLGYLRIRHRNRRILRRWAREEAELEAAGLAEPLFSWDHVTEDPDAWKGENADDEEDEAWRGR